MSTIALDHLARRSSGSASTLSHILMMTGRSLTTLLRRPGELAANILIGAFFLFVFDAALGESFSFLPNLSGVNYVAFILPFSVISSALNSYSGQAMVRDIESGYFDKLRLTPVSRSALLLGHILTGGVAIAFQSAVIIGIGFLLGLEVVTGISGVLVTVGFALLVGIGFGGFTVGVALRTGNAGATQSASFLFFPLSFLTTALFPLDFLEGWLATVARFNPITYILDAIRSVLITGWDAQALLFGLAAATALCVLPFVFAVTGLRRRMRSR